MCPRPSWARVARNRRRGGSDDAELRNWVDCGLRSLPADQRETLELAYFLGCSCEEIAAIMDCAVGTVKARMFRAPAAPAHGDAAAGGAARTRRKEKAHE